MAFFGYKFSPFYAELPADAMPTPVATNGSSTVRWFRHKFAQEPSEYEIAADEGRRLLLQELYDDAVAEQRRSRRQTGRWLGFGDGDA